MRHLSPFSLSISTPLPRSVALRDSALSPPSGGIRLTDRDSERLGAESRLRTSREYSMVKAGAVVQRGRCCLLLALAHPAERSRVGFIASKRGVGGAVQRNRARRRLREIVRRRWCRVPETGYWLVFVASRGALTATHQELATEVERLLAQAGALEPIAEPSEPEGLTR